MCMTKNICDKMAAHNMAHTDCFFKKKTLLPLYTLITPATKTSVVTPHSMKSILRLGHQVQRSRPI